MDSVFDTGVLPYDCFKMSWFEVDLHLHALLAGVFRNISHKKRKYYF